LLSEDHADTQQAGNSKEDSEEVDSSDEEVCFVKYV